MAVQYDKIALCSKQKIALLDGYAGEFANVNIPFVGLYFANGGTFSNPSASAPQFGGTQGNGSNWKPGRFVKSFGVCA